MSSRSRLLVAVVGLLCTLCLVGGQPRVRQEGDVIDNVFRVGAVLSNDGKTQEMSEARMGYQLFFNEVKKLHNGRGMRVEDKNGRAFYFGFDFMWRDDSSNTSVHDREVEALLDEEKVHFLFGSHPEYALSETQLSNSRQRMNLQCCVGPDVVYKQGFPLVFGIPASNIRYTELAVRSMMLRGLRRVAILQREDNLFTKTTCEAAVADINKFGDFETEAMDVAFVAKYDESRVNDTRMYEDVARRLKKENVDAVVACIFVQEASLLVEALHQSKRSLKSLFITVAPTIPQWVSGMGELSEHVLSAAQWHTKLKYTDSFFGTNQEYISKFEALHGEVSTYIAAGASAVGYVTYFGIKYAFWNCDISKTGGVVDQLLFNSSALECDDQNEDWTGYERVRQTIKGMNTDTFFGKIKFNAYQRNDGIDPPTTQVLPAKGSRRIDAVLPIGAANAQLVMPGRNAFKPTCAKGFFVGEDEFDPCDPCIPGEISDEENASHCNKCPLGSWVGESGQSVCKICPAGTITRGKGEKQLAGCVCKEGYFNPRGAAGEECQPCPDGAKCNGTDDFPIPEPGYWMNKTVPSEVYECEPADVCQGGLESSCKIGREGRLCSECSKDYFGVIERCFPCPHKAAVVTMVVLLVLGWYILNVVISNNVASLEMMLSWAQLANVIGDVGLRWPKSLETMFGTANLLDFDVDILEPSCLFHWSFTHNFVVQLLLPFVMSMLAFCGYMASVVALKYHKRAQAGETTWLRKYFSWLVHAPETEEELAQRWDKTIATFLSSVEVTYVTIAKYCFDVFKCEDIAGVSVLRTSPSVECSNREHALLIVLAIIGTLFYSIGYLAFVAYKMFQLDKTRSFQCPVNLRRYGFLYRRFELDYFWTPIIILIRRLIFVVTLVFLNNPAFQAGGLAVIIIVSLMLHVYTAPYVDTYLDVMFSFLLVALMFEAFSGVMFYSTNLPHKNRVILEWIVLLVLFVLICVFVVFFYFELSRKYCQFNVKQMHCNEILQQQGLDKASKVLRTWSKDYRGVAKTVSHELLETFNPYFIHKALDKRPEFIPRWHRLSTMLKDYMSDQSETSYLSKTGVAKFWRKLVDRFPELVDFLAVADEENRQKFREFATTLYQDFYLKNKVEPLPIFGILNWRDRAPMAQWLAMASEEDRQFFTTFMTELFREASGPEMANRLNQKVSSNGAAFGRDFDESASNNWKTLRVIKEIKSGRGPLAHSASLSQSFSTAVSFNNVRVSTLGSLEEEVEEGTEENLA
ncbi:hypothetical protein BSKO_02104 [Bryopsis sp. KO-2023]|nr:hypothetical protein BSKO_02104 [Bryopsis sp. KO-2023]